uniref:Purine nucleoside phosphorylase n=1 Tax=Parascaris univalens TaxID=6257 RepID=A0A915APJ0_PARUN
MLGLALNACRIMGFSYSKEIDAKLHADIVHVADVIKGLVTLKEIPKVGIICGSGLGEIGDIIKESQILPYSKIPGFPSTNVAGHKGNLVFGYLGGKYVVCLQGRFHPYEHQMNLALCALPVRIMHKLGVEILITSNAAGGINEYFKRGDMMLIRDHIFMPALAGLSPLVGLNGDEWGPRFVSLHNQYDEELRAKGVQVAKQLDITMHEGIYVMNGGPQYESAAEIEFFKRIGGDALGMSTCHEVVVARQCGIRVVGMSLITNIATSTANPSHAEVIEAAREASKRACKFVEALIMALE